MCTKNIGDEKDEEVADQMKALRAGNLDDDFSEGETEESAMREYGLFIQISGSQPRPKIKSRWKIDRTWPGSTTGI